MISPLFLCLSPLREQESHAQRGAQCGCYGRQNGDDGLQNFLPKFFLVHRV